MDKLFFDAFPSYFSEEIEVFLPVKINKTLLFVCQHLFACSFCRLFVRMFVLDKEIVWDFYAEFFGCFTTFQALFRK